MRCTTLSALLFVLLSACGAAAPAPAPAAPAAPRPDDVATVDGIVRAYYQVVDVAPDAPRQWARDATLYAPWIRFVGLGRDGAVTIYDHARLVADTEPMIRTGFRERELHRTVRRYGNIVHVDSTYETRTGPDGATRSRGVNSLELYWDGARWWIASVLWQSEAPALPIPPELLPP